jgi:hypothetical protein
MAEIKSTMDLVMERAARYGKASDEDLQRDEARKKGMQKAAEYLEGSVASLAETLNEEKKELQQTLREGIAEGLLRNIFLPRDEVQQERTDKAVQGLVELSGGAGDVATICRELQQIMQGYQQHRKELQGQLEQQIKMQYEQMMAQSGGAQGEEFNLDPATQAKFREEWEKIEAELHRRYHDALEQHKINLKTRLGL